MHRQKCVPRCSAWRGAQRRRSLGEGRRDGRGGRGGRAHAVEEQGQGRGPARGASRKGVARRQKVLAKSVQPLQPSTPTLSNSCSLSTKAGGSRREVRRSRLVQAAQLLAGFVHHARRRLLDLRAAAPLGLPGTA